MLKRQVRDRSGRSLIQLWDKLAVGGFTKFTISCDTRKEFNRKWRLWPAANDLQAFFSSSLLISGLFGVLIPIVEVTYWQNSHGKPAYTNQFLALIMDLYIPYMSRIAKM